jgi:predicted Zn-dependent peptidase
VAFTARQSGGEITLFAQTASADDKSLRAVLLSETRRLRQEMLNPQELARARNFAIGDWTMQHESLRERAYRVALEEVQGVSGDWPTRLAAVSALDVQRAAQRYLTGGASVLVKAVS